MASRSYRWWALALLLIAVVFVATVFLWPRLKPPEPVKMEAIRPDCPVKAIVIQNDTSMDVRAFPKLTLSGVQSLVPEFNDCQQLLQGNSPTYGPLVGVFAAEGLNDRIKRMYAMIGSTPAMAVAVAEVLDWGSGDYAPLGISRKGDGFNCLYMWAEQRGGQPFLQARMLRMMKEPDCGADVEVQYLLASSTPPLTVTLSRPDPQYKGVDYPGVARWDWDRDAKVQYIGIGCYDAWCEISPGALVASKDHDDPTLTRDERVRRRVKGWYDEERLAVVDASGTLVPSDIVGTIMPVHNLDAINSDIAHFHGLWPVVAMTSLSVQSAVYKTKFNFDQGDFLGKRFNMIALCNGDRVACGIPASTPIKDCHSGAPVPTDEWWAKIDGADGGPPAYRCVIRRTHPGLIIPGMVRWRWVLNDQGGWIKCPDGCCELVGEF